MVIPEYIRSAAIQDPKLSFRWDEWGDEAFMAPVDEALAERLANLSQRANVALGSATAEWIVYRFATLTDLAEPLRCLETAWVQQIDFLYSWDWNLDVSWTGPIKGPIKMAMEQVSLGLENERDDLDPSPTAAELDKLARLLIKDPAPYVRWRNLVVARFEALYRRSPADRLGDVVPRQAADPNIDFAPEQTESLVNKYLKSVDYRENPLLNSPDMMVELGFEGTPYVFNLQDDRRRRLEW